MPKRHQLESPEMMTQPPANPDLMTESAETVARELGTVRALGLIVDPSQTDSIKANLELLDAHYRTVLSVSSVSDGRAV